MRILFATPLYPPEIGGPAKYAFHLGEELKKKGHKIKVATYLNILKFPFFLRPVIYFFSIFFKVAWSDKVIAFDASSVGFPASLACMILRKKIIIRVGGDFLWESYVERTGHSISLSDFYKKPISLTFKEKIIKKLINFSFFQAEKIVVNSSWFADILKNPYVSTAEKFVCIENFFQKKESFLAEEPKMFIASSRSIKLKNLDFLKQIFTRQKEIKLVTEKIEHSRLMELIKKSYAVVVASYSDVNPNLVSEGLAYGKPFIVTKYNGLPSVLKDMGIEIDPFDELSIQKAVEFLMEPKNYDFFVQKIKDSTYEYTWEMVASEFEKIII